MVDLVKELASNAEETPSRVPSRAQLAITTDELAAAQLTPRCIVRGHTYADVAQVVAPGGTGKTTLMLHELICVVLGRPLWGCKVESPGWCLVVTAEDRRERLVARIRELMAAFDLSEVDRNKVRRDLLIWDVTGKDISLTYSTDGNIRLTTIADEIIEAYRVDPPAVVLFDPLVSFGVSEERLNTNEQALVTAARRIVNGLNCCVRYVHHTGQANAREKKLDQYAGRGGTALPDGSRMTFVLQTWDAEEKNHRPPPTCKPDRESSILILARPKLSYAPPNLPLIWIKRTGYQFEHFVELATTPEQQIAARADQLERFLKHEVAQKRYYTRKDLEDSTERLNMTRAKLRTVLSDLQVGGKVVDAPLPEGKRKGGRQTFICPVNLADQFGEEGSGSDDD